MGKSCSSVRMGDLTAAGAAGVVNASLIPVPLLGAVLSGWRRCQCGCGGAGLVQDALLVPQSTLHCSSQWLAQLGITSGGVVDLFLGHVVVDHHDGNHLSLWVLIRLRPRERSSVGVVWRSGMG